MTELTMRYPHSLEESGEYLRLAIQYMKQQLAGFHPTSFAIWYEFASGINKALCEELNELQNKGIQLTNDMAETLYQKHISECDAEVTKRLHADLELILENITCSTHKVGNQTSEFDNSLTQYSRQLATKPDFEILQNVVSSMIAETRAMRGSVSQLQEELTTSTNEMHRLQEQLRLVREEAITDTLTGLANRKGFLDALELVVNNEERTGNTCLLMLDIDHFKQINDNYGHLLGDKAIRQIGQTLKANVKGNDTAARYGGEEFAILLPETSLTDAQRVAEQIRSKVERIRIKRMNTGAPIDAITISIGVGQYRAGEHIDTMIHRVDMALYSAKRNGRNRVEVEEVKA